MSAKFGIISIVYGGTTITNLAVAARIAQAAEQGKPFAINNDTLGGDPWVGTAKSLTVVFHWTLQDVQILSGREFSEITFPKAK